jgi:hypothetical protein
MSFTCHRHTEMAARARCVGCGSLLCSDCRRRVSGRNWCAPCVPDELRAKLKGRRSPRLAALLSLVPGFGQVFTGNVMRGLVFGASAIALAALEMQPPALVLLFLYVFNLFDAHSLALERNARVEGRELDPVERRERRLVAGFAAVTAGFAVLQMTVAPQLDAALLWPVALLFFAMNAIGSRRAEKRVKANENEPVAVEVAHAS